MPLLHSSRGPTDTVRDNNPTVRGARRDLPLPDVGEPAAAAAAGGAVLVPDLHVLGVPVQVGGGEAPDASGEDK